MNIALTGRLAQPSTSLTTSNAVGKYRFEGLSAGDYTVTVSCDGYASTSPIAVHIGSQSIFANADLTLQRISSNPNTATPASPGPSLKFQSSGIRGLIDPGGYSASAGAGATVMLRGIADVKWTGKSYGASVAKDWPCLLEPALIEAFADHPMQADVYRRLGQFYGTHDQPAKAMTLLKTGLGH